MAAPKIDYEEEFFDGMTVPRLAQLFRLDRRTVTEKLRPLRPTGDRRGAPTYQVVDAAPYLVEPIVDIAKYLAEAGPGDLPAALQAQYWNAQNSMLKFKENSGDLWRTSQVLEVLIGAFRSLTQSLRLLADRVEAQTGLTPEQRAIIEKEISDKALDMLRKKLVDDFELYAGFKDKEQLADIRVDDIGLDEDDDNG
ncbi:MAG: DUF1441 family protein [Lysobacter sp.]